MSMSLSQHKVLPMLGLLDLLNLKITPDIFTPSLFLKMPPQRYLPEEVGTIPRFVKKAR